MNFGADLFIVDTLNLRHDFRRERRQIGSVAVLNNLLRPFPAGNRTTDRVEPQNPTQGELAHGCSRRQEAADVLDCLQTDVVVDTRERLADVKGFSVSIEIAMIVGGERGIRTQLAREQTAGKWHTRQDPDLLLLGAGKEELGLAAGGSS
jgi:hypothetical protein